MDSADDDEDEGKDEEEEEKKKSNKASGDGGDDDDDDGGDDDGLLFGDGAGTFADDASPVPRPLLRLLPSLEPLYIGKPP